MMTLAGEPKELVQNISRTQVRNRSRISFFLDIPNIGCIECQRILRGVSGKRLLCFGCRDEQEYVAKLFFHPRRAGRHWLRSYEGHALFLAKNIPTPPIRYAGYLQADDLYAIVFDFISGPLSGERKAGTPAAGDQYMNKIIVCLAEHHQKGVLQQDVNPGNFLLQDDIILSLDGDHVRLYQEPIEKKPALQNLALLFSNFAVRSRRDICRYYTLYAGLRQWPVTEQSLGFLLRSVRWKQVGKRLKIVFRKGRRTRGRRAV